MKNILPFLLCVVVVSAFGQSKTDAALKDQINSTIRAVTTSNGVTRAALSDDFDDLIDSKVNIIQGVTALGTNTYSVTISSGVTSYTDGLELTVKIANANTGTATLNVNAIGAKDIVDVASGDLEAGKYYKFVYNGTAFQLVGGLGGSDITDITGLQDSLSAKQNVLVSGTNIKTLESVSLLGSGNIDLSKDDVGLGNVDNTSDANKQVSTAQQTAIDAKVVQTITNGVTTSAPSQDATFDALALKQTLDADLTAVAANGSSLQQIRVPSGGGTLEYFTPLTNPSTTNGDIIYWNAGAYQRLGIGSAGQTLSISAGLPAWSAASSGTLSSLLAATATNTIDNTDKAQVWSWNSLATGKGMTFSSSSTASSSSPILVSFEMTGANSSSGQTTEAAFFSNTKTGSTSTNIAAGFTASGGTDNVAISVGNGFVRLASQTANGVFYNSGSTGNLVTSSGLLYNSSAGQLTTIRTSTDATLSASLIVQHTKSTAMADGAGAAMVFVNRDDSGVDNFVGLIGTKRNGADNTADLSFQSYLAGTPTERLIVRASGSVGVAGFSTAYVAKTALYTLTAADHTVEVTSGTHTQTLPTAVGITGQIFVITNSGSGTVTVGTTSSQTFVNVVATPTTLTLAQFNTVIVQSNGANWLRLTSL